jgi:hypothetical protein
MFAVAVGAALTVLPLFGGSAYAAANTDRLNPPEQLNSGERLISPNGEFVLIMQSDGNLVEYAPGNRPVWATGTNRPNSIALMQTDGNLVVIAPGNVPVWATGTSGNAGADTELQSDGNVVVYATGHIARWASGTQVGGTSVRDRIAAIATNEAGNPNHNHETGTNCNFYSGALGTGPACGNNWRAEEWCADFAHWVLAWVAAQGAELSSAFTDGYLAGQARSLSLGARLRLAASMALANEPATAQFWRHLNLPPARSFLVTAMRLAGTPPPDDGARDEIVGGLYLRHRVCVAWTDPADLTALVPCAGTDSPAPAERELALTLARDVTDLTGQRCSVGAAVGTVPCLADAAALARQICGQAPAERVPRQVRGLADVFAELAVDRIPAVSDWLRGIADKLLLGTDLVPTLHTYYRCDTNRLRASAALRIHPRTLDYRLRRAHALTGVDPHSTTGIRILSVVTTRVLAGAWPGAAAAGS